MENFCLKAWPSTTVTHGTQALANQQQTWNAIPGWNVDPENTQCLRSGIQFIAFSVFPQECNNDVMSNPSFIITIFNPEHKKTNTMYCIRCFCKGRLRNRIQEKQDHCRKRMNE